MTISHIGPVLALVLVTSTSCRHLGSSGVDDIDQERVFMAVGTGDTNELVSLLESGLSPNEQVKGECEDMGWRLLHLAIIQNQPVVVALLLARGATPDTRDNSGRRPIDLAYPTSTNICEMLRRRPLPAKLLAGIPLSVWDELQPEILAALWDSRPVFISLNGMDPPPELLSWISARKGRKTKDACPRSDAIQLKWREIPPSHTQYQHKISGVYGYVLELTIARASGSSYTFRVRSATAEGLSGGGCSGDIENAYGYWIKTGKESWVE